MCTTTYTRRFKIRVQRGEVWLANLDPTKGSEQRGTRPVIIFPDNIVVCHPSYVYS
ncbi:MAG: type II toxin-antitoxin system PemK/MazF family toxin [Nostoc sp. DedSLP03]|uniref:type II toxin-antitoxin system PemK/MazF family toxin n=1 Tax=Nostoc sp. DedSLP03 TaxID=3075400 RepID=UPI002AD20AC4|nr:type II toxin-antitoxin system PemK/MazF family toxin [Nostoc sp. DedSLP03]MDZ7966745.1 type II toxin-antitoxin system PemK/MazF family toxin [Nostoc sp. DedSLP03]